VSAHHTADISTDDTGSQTHSGIIKELEALLSVEIFVHYKC